MEVPVSRFLAVFKWMLPIYGALHFIPPILFKRKVFFKSPLKVLLRSALGTGRSSAFLGLFVIIYQCGCACPLVVSPLINLIPAINCFNHQAHEYLLTHSTLKVPRHILDAIFVSKFSFWLPGFMSGLALFAEEERRRAELAMYVLPKALESAWIISRGKVGVLKGWRGGEGIVSLDASIIFV